MGVRVARVRRAAMLMTGMLLALSGCNGGTSGTESPEAAHPAMQIITALVPGQSTEQIVRSELGEPGGTEEPLQGEWTWLYPLSESGDSYARVTLDTSSTVRIVKSVEVVEPQLTVDDLTAELGAPDVIFEELTGDRSVLAFPLLGIEAVVPGDPNQPDSVVSSLQRGPTQSVQAYLNALEQRSDVRIIQRP